MKPSVVAVNLVSKILTFIDFFTPEENRPFYM